MPCRGCGGARCGCHGADDQAGADGAALDGEWVEQCADGAAASRTTAPGSLQAQVTGKGFAPCVTAAGHVLSTLRLPVVAKMSRARMPSSPTARSCGCLHRGSNAQAVSKTGDAARSHVLMASASGVARRGRSASRRAHSWGRRGSGKCACTCSMCTGLSRARAQREGRPKAARAACVAACRTGGTPAGGGLVSLDSKRLETKLIAGWTVLPAL
jgi:hypothetical protein